MELVHALKEWQVAVDALEQGETIVLLRKGGIREAEGRFAVQHGRVWLYPTVEHQKPELLKPQYADQVKPVASGWQPDHIRLGSWAEITNVFPVTDATAVMNLLPFHVWNAAFVAERLQWKPTQPIFVLLLRVQRLIQPVSIPYSASFGGCKSWIDLDVPIATQPSEPAIDAPTYRDHVATIQSMLS